jgi:cytochrome P450/NADPH-cytochrome P450 reductase
MPDLTTIDQLPGPHAVPFLGNLLDLNTPNPMDKLIEWGREFGPIYRLQVPGNDRVVVSGADLVEEICDDARFGKQLGAGLKAGQEGQTSQGLFTSETADPMWRRAHNILMAPFSQQAMRGYLPRMIDIAGQLVDKWARLNPDDEVDVPADMTALTLDTIALCGFDYRFNSLYRDTPHPFVAAMVRNLLERQKEAKELPIQRKLRIQARRQSREDQEFQVNLVKGLMADRRRLGAAADNTDLLGLMLTGVDKQSGLTLPDDNIVAQCLTFLVAGHETTSGLLSFAVYFLMKNPTLAARARAEADEVLGGDAEPGYEQIHRLTYIRQILDETLRLWPTAPMFTRTPLQDTVVGGRYAFPKDTGLSILVPMLHRDRSVWGDDAEEFNPDRFQAERFTAVPPTAYRPFGTGLRACIGRQFALQEATLVLGLLIQRFEFIDHRNYQLHTKSTLTVKPADLWIKLRPRTDRPLRVTIPASSVGVQQVAAQQQSAGMRPASSGHGTPLLVLFGSNLGTAEGIANRLGREGTERGYQVTVAALDDHGPELPPQGAVLIVCSSYNGEPPENATAFLAALGEQALAAEAFAGVSYTVFGCGDTDWAATYQAVPKLLDRGLEEHGARRIHPRGEGNANGDFDDQYRSWHADLWTDVAAALQLPSEPAAQAPGGPRLSISIVNRQLTNPVILSYEATPALITRNVELTANGSPGSRSTRHVDIALPAGMHYRAGDHLGVLPRNSLALIRRVMSHFRLDAGMYLTIAATSGAHTHLPIDEPAPLLGILGSCVELQAGATRADIDILAEHTPDPEQQAELRSLTGDDSESRARYRTMVREPGLSVLDLLERYPACRLPFPVFLDLLPALAPRYYSISSSPVLNPQSCSVTEGVLHAPARCGVGDFDGVCSTYLQGLEPGSTIFVFARQPTIPFRPPADPAVPMIMVGAGTGLAPFRGFLQERAEQKANGATLAPSVLFFGCRTPADRLYADELDTFEKSADVLVYTAFSRQPVDGRKYAQHVMLAHQDECWDLIDRGGQVFVCGNARTLAPGVRSALQQIYAVKTGSAAAAAEEWLAGLRREHRYLEDIWGAN